MSGAGFIPAPRKPPGHGATAKPPRIRAFVALDFEDSMRARISALMEELRGRVPGVRWVRPEGVHVTLRFLGWCEPAALERLEPLLAAAAAACPPSDARIGGVGVFPERGGPRVIWLSVELPEPILALQRECEKAAVQVGFPAEPRPFRPHLTLGRFKERASRPRLAMGELGTTRLDQVVLFRSQLQSGGSVYTPLARFALGGGDG
ncbi:MAG TPA: RNA 2',3'-cyclic phosphodiesterase [Vicinamibacteria bacterium]|jgi:2'-5' RNA ligase